MTAQPIGRRERKKQAVREKICQETVELIRLHGIEGTTIEDICERADIAKKTFYNYYPSRHDLLIQICQSDLLLRTRLNVEGALANCKGLEACLKYIFNEMQSNIAQADRVEREMIDYMIINLSNNRTQSANQLNFMNDCFRTLYENNLDDLKPDLDTGFCAEITVGMINAMMVNWLNDESYDISSNYDCLLKFMLESMLK
ncbi:TetR/AcrR family transcriptional regulator [Endozoicomonas arenosclerae]|uniref:TetR/AcrR family transcriptional regulator n=1 Tax=Endozoicomonas arenosclerae TaxID=1633495 RepID=UPI000ACD3986|nr:TetR/AcrR family transcriptional regulator [Endozoicomonas arenosclerae]